MPTAKLTIKKRKPDPTKKDNRVPDKRYPNIKVRADEGVDYVYGADYKGKVTQEDYDSRAGKIRQGKSEVHNTKGYNIPKGGWKGTYK